MGGGGQNDRDALISDVSLSYFQFWKAWVGEKAWGVSKGLVLLNPVSSSSC